MLTKSYFILLKTNQAMCGYAPGTACDFLSSPGRT